MMAATEKLHPSLSKRQSSTSWRVDPEIFPSGLEGLQGTINISPAWFQQGHEVNFLYWQYFIIRQLISIETVQPHPQVGASLKKPDVLDWLDCITQSNSILSAILAVIHPELYNASQDTFNWCYESGHASFLSPSFHHIPLRAASMTHIAYVSLTDP